MHTADHHSHTDISSHLTGALGRHFGAGSDPIEHWPAARLAEYHREAIADQIAHVFANNAFYRAKCSATGVSPGDFRTLDDLGRFPFTLKDELRGDPWILLSVPKDQVRLAHTSTGTTGGDWSYILYSWDDMFAHDLATATRLLMPVQAGDVVINALPYEMSSSGQSFQRSLQAGQGALVIPVGKGGFYSDPHKTVKIMADLSASVLITTPPYAMLLAEVAAERGLLPGGAIRPRFIWLTGEGCSSAYRRRLEETWRCDGLVFYGSMECGSIAIECPQKAGSHLSAGQVFVEIIDPATGKPQPPGQVGEVVATVLARKASPLIRFRTQDLGLIDPASCPCGIKLPRLHLRGRIVDQVAAGGKSAEPAVSPYMIEEVLYAEAAMGGNYQIYVDAGRLLVEAEPFAGATDTAAAAERIAARLAERGLSCEFHWVAHVPRTGGKTRRIRPLADREAVMSQPCLLGK